MLMALKTGPRNLIPAKSRFTMLKNPQPSKDDEDVVIIDYEDVVEDVLHWGLDDMEAEKKHEQEMQATSHARLQHRIDRKRSGRTKDASMGPQKAPSGRRKSKSFKDLHVHSRRICFHEDGDQFKNPTKLGLGLNAVLGKDVGALVTIVEKDSLAEKMGVHVGWFAHTIGNTDVSKYRNDDIVKLVASTRPLTVTFFTKDHPQHPDFTFWTDEAVANSKALAVKTTSKGAVVAGMTVASSADADGRIRPCNRIQRIHSISLAEQKTVVETKFLFEDVDLRFNFKSWLEEFFCQTLFTYFNVLSLPLISPIMKTEGLRNAGFIPLQNASSGHGRGFVFFCIFSAMSLIAAVPLVGALIWEYNRQNGIKGGNIDIIECVICVALITLRLYVVAVKYAYMPRRKLLHIRNVGRPSGVAQSEQILSWTSRNVSSAAVLEQLDLSFFRSCMSIDEAANSFFQLQDDVSPEVLESMRSFVGSEEETKQTSSGNAPPRVGSVGNHIVPSKRSRQKTNVRVTPIKHQVERLGHMEAAFDTSIVSLRDVLLYCASHSVKENYLPRFTVILTYIAASVAPLTRWILGKPPLGTSAFEALVICCNFFATCTLSGSCIAFAVASATLFRRRWSMMNIYFQFLLPPADDARKLEKVDKELKYSELRKLPPLTAEAKNVYLWAKGRDIVRNFAALYERRAEHFLGAFFLVVGFGAVFQTIRILNETNGDVSKFRVTPGIVFASFWVLLFLGSFVYIVRAGMLANRQIKYHQNAILRHLRKYRGELEFYRSRECRNSPDDQDQHLVQGERVAMALHSLSKELENEAETFMVRILTVPVDKKMLSAVFTIFGSFAAALGQVVAFKLYGQGTVVGGFDHSQTSNTSTAL